VICRQENGANGQDKADAEEKEKFAVEEAENAGTRLQHFFKRKQKIRGAPGLNHSSSC
jgi:hypothetical protein